jgi:uncharacterized protein involved in type VI secretion and phage assembly
MAYVNWPGITIDGFPVDTTSEGNLEKIVVDDDLNLPTTFMITLRSIQQDMPPYRIGQKVEIAPPDDETPIVIGEITTITGDFDGDGRRVHIRGFDVSHRLHRGRQTRTFLNVTDSDICRKVASAAGIDVGTIDQTDTTHDHVSQANQSDWEFLRARAKANGFLLGFLDGKLNFTKPTDSATAPGEGTLMSKSDFTLVFGQELLEYRPRLTSSEQVTQVEVRGWDRQNKRELVGQAAAGTTSAKVATADPAKLAGTFGSPVYVRADHPGATSDELETAATAIAEHIGSSFAEAEGIARGTGKLRAGSAVSISGVPEDFCGQFVLTHTRHVFDHGGYRTNFEISGQHRRSLLGLVAHATATGGVTAGKVGSDRIFGVVTAVVTGNDDPEQQGRVKIQLPWLAADYESDWAPVVQAGAGPNSGSVWMPEVHDEVLVAFENGDIGHPFVIGGLYNGVDKPSLGNGIFDNGKVKRRGFVSRKGHKLVFFDAEGTSGIAVMTSDNKLRIALNETRDELHVYGDGKVIVESANEIDLNAAKVSVKADQDLTLRAGKVTIKSDGVVDIDGAVIQLN